MKVLWFANTPCGAATKLYPDLHVGGWLKSLEEQLVNYGNVELSVCFYWRDKLQSFQFDKTKYYPIYRAGNNTKVKRVINRALQRDNNENELKQLLEVIDAVLPDVIHIHGTEENFGLIQEFTQIPVIISIQGILSPYSEKYYSGVPFWQAFWYEGLKPKLLFRSSHFDYKGLKKRAERERKILSHAQYVIGRTNWDKRVTRVLASDSQYFTGNEMLRSAFYQKQWTKINFSSPIQIVTIMSSGLYKGLETIVNTARILQQNNSPAFEWIVIGQKNSDDLALIVKRWLKTDFQSYNIHLVGMKNEVEVADILVKSDIYCQVSHIENSPNSVCEAMLIGMPIVASFAGGTDSILENNKEGILVQDGDAYSLAGAIREIAENFDNAVKLAINARDTGHKRNNQERIVKQQVSIYETVIKDALCKK